MIIPVVISDSNLVAAGAVTVDTEGTVGAPVVLPVNGVAGLAGGLGAALVALAVPLATAGGEDPGVGHGEDGDEGGDGGSGELHFGWKLEIELRFEGL